jgi:hypothetical protein
MATLVEARCAASRCGFPSWTIPLSISAARPIPPSPKRHSAFPARGPGGSLGKTGDQPTRLGCWPTPPTCPPAAGLAIGAIGQNQDVAGGGPRPRGAWRGIYQWLGFPAAVKGAVSQYTPSWPGATRRLGARRGAHGTGNEDENV